VSSEDKKQAVLGACLGQSQNLAALIEYADDSVVSKTILNKPVGTITLFAFDKGQGLSEHTSPYDAVVQVLEGSSQINIGGKAVEVSAGELIVMPANVPHALDAQERFKMLLIMIRD
jgi:quercetin dioxygenase-like cupin family protein